LDELLIAIKGVAFDQRIGRAMREFIGAGNFIGAPSRALPSG